MIKPTPAKNQRNKTGLLFVFWLALILVTGSCTKRLFVVDSEKRLEIAEQRIVALERDRERLAKETREEVEKLKEEIQTKLASFQQSQRFFLEELNKIQKDLQDITQEQEITGDQARKAKAGMVELKKRLGDQMIALNELSGFFKSEVQYAEKKESPEQKAFAEAFAAYRKKEFGDAMALFEGFRNRFHGSKLSDDALYFMGYIHFLNEHYEQASLRLFELVEQYPDSDRHEEATWWLGVTLERSGDLGAALDMYRRLTGPKASDRFRIGAETRIEDLKEMIETKNGR